MFKLNLFISTWHSIQIDCRILLMGWGVYCQWYYLKHHCSLRWLINAVLFALFIQCDPIILIKRQPVLHIRGDVPLSLCKYCLFLAEILALCDSFCLVSREFYFDRSPRIFENILGLYRKGELHLTESVCPKDFVGELEYWGLSALYLEPCCAYTLQRASWLLPVVDHGVDKDDHVRHLNILSFLKSICPWFKFSFTSSGSFIEWWKVYIFMIFIWKPHNDGPFKVCPIEKEKFKGFSTQREAQFTIGLIELLFQIDHFDGLCFARLRSVIWTLFEDPNSSSAARVCSRAFDTKCDDSFDAGLGCCQFPFPSFLHHHANPLHHSNISGDPTSASKAIFKCFQKVGNSTDIVAFVAAHICQASANIEIKN